MFKFKPLVFTALATTAFGMSIVNVPSANAYGCISQIRSNLNSKAGLSVSKTQIPAQIICHEFDVAQRASGYKESSKEPALVRGIEKAGLTGKITPSDLSFNSWNTRVRESTYVAPTRTVTSTPSRSNTSYSKPKTSTASRCPTGESYAHIKIGGLLFKKTLFKGCGAPSELAYWRNVSSKDMSARWKNFGNALQKAGDDYNRSIQNSRGTNCTTNFIGSTAYTNCY